MAEDTNTKQTLKLSRPIYSGEGIDDKTDTLTFREPRGKDVMATGSPMTFKSNEDGSMSPEINTAVCGKYISVLANVPPSSVADMGASDFIAAAGIIVGFFQ